MNLKAEVTFLIVCFFFIYTKISSQNYQQKKTQSKPNIIFILADDLAVNALSAYNPKLFNTPNIAQTPQGPQDRPGPKKTKC